MDDHFYVQEAEAVYGYSEWEPSEISEAGKEVTPEEYWRHYYEHPFFRYEWNNGILEEKPVSDWKEEELFEWFYFLVKEYLKVYPQGVILPFDMAFRLKKGNNSARSPDAPFVSKENKHQPNKLDSRYSGTYDFCIESLSSGDLKGIHRDTVQKKREYEKEGIREYFILDAYKINMAFYRLDKNKKYQKIPQKGGVIESEVLKGFSFRVEHLESLPDFEEIMDDPVYSHYLLHRLRIERQAKENERQAKENERQAKENERQAKEEAIENERRAKKKLEQNSKIFLEKMREAGIENPEKFLS